MKKETNIHQKYCKLLITVTIDAERDQVAKIIAPPKPTEVTIQALPL